MTCQYVAGYCAVNNLSPKVTLSQIEKLLENNFMTTVDHYDSTTKTENLNSQKLQEIIYYFQHLKCFKPRFLGLFEFKEA